eukprot:gene1101-1436_t
MATQIEQEVQALREENAALLEALHLAQLGGVDLQGHLNKWNPDASEQGIFSQEWELRFFVLNGSLLKYYSSERDVGYEAPRGLLELHDCSVEVEEPSRPSGPVIFQIIDPQDELLLRLSGDSAAVGVLHVDQSSTDLAAAAGDEDDGSSCQLVPGGGRGLTTGMKFLELTTQIWNFTAAAALGAAAADGDAAGGAVRDGKPKRQPMTGSSPVHLTVTDSILTENKDWGLKRHEGILNLCCALFTTASLLIEWLGLLLLRQEQQAFAALLKKDMPAPVAAKQLAAASSASEGLVSVLNVLNVTASLVLPCLLVLWNK